MTTGLSGLLPAQPRTRPVERLRAGVGALVGIAITGLLATLTFGVPEVRPLLIAPMGASAVLLFAVPASPLAQPFSILGGNFLAALVGVTAAWLIPSPLVASAVAVGGTIALMASCRCVHPPSGAVALTAVLGGPAVHAAGYHFVVAPVMLDSALLTLAAVAYNNATGTSYPHRAHAPVHPHAPTRPVPLTDADFDAVLADYGEALDIGRDDLRRLHEELVGRAEVAR